MYHPVCSDFRGQFSLVLFGFQLTVFHRLVKKYKSDVNRLNAKLGKRKKNDPAAMILKSKRADLLAIRKSQDWINGKFYLNFLSNTGSAICSETLYFVDCESAD